MYGQSMNLTPLASYANNFSFGTYNVQASVDIFVSEERSQS
jgi:hypothetical protein